MQFLLSVFVDLDVSVVTDVCRQLCGEETIDCLWDFWLEVRPPVSGSRQWLALYMGSTRATLCGESGYEDSVLRTSAPSQAGPAW